MKNNEGQTPLHIATKRGDLEIVELLLKHIKRVGLLVPYALAMNCWVAIVCAGVTVFFEQEYLNSDVVQ